MRLELVIALTIWANQAIAQAPQLQATEIYERVLPSMCAVLALSETGVELGFGSGFIWNDDQVVTNRHVIAGASHVNLECNGKPVVATGIVRHSDSIDLVVLKVFLQNPKKIQIRQSEIKPGESVFAMGNPLGLTNTITAGIVGGRREFDGVEYIQVSADINPGNSGGPIVDGFGRLVGVATMTLQGSQGLNFGLPISYLPELVPSDIDFSALPVADVGVNTSPTLSQLSSLSFRGLPLGSPCSGLKHIQHIGQLRGNEQNDRRYTGRIVGRATLLGSNVGVEYDCKYGSLVSGRYVDIPDSRIELVQSGLEEKYGPGPVVGVGLQYKAGHILVQRKREAVEIIDRLDAGADFETLAREKSIDPSAASNGGDLGWFSQNQMVRPFSLAVQAMDDGDYSSQPVQTQFGWHVIFRESSKGSPNIWELGEGKEIDFSGSVLIYSDSKLQEILDRKEILRAVKTDEL